MAHRVSFFLPLLVISALIPRLLSNPYSAEAANEIGKSLITETCSHTEFPDICTSTLESDPRSFSANLTGLSRIGIQLVATKVNDTAVEALKLVQNATDYVEWGKLQACSGEYNASVHRMKEGLQCMDEHKYGETFQILDLVSAKIVYCRDLNTAKLIERSTFDVKVIAVVKAIVHLLF